MAPVFRPAPVQSGSQFTLVPDSPTQMKMMGLPHWSLTPGWLLWTQDPGLPIMTQAQVHQCRPKYQACPVSYCGPRHQADPYLSKYQAFLYADAGSRPTCPRNPVASLPIDTPDTHIDIESLDRLTGERFLPGKDSL